MTATWKDVRRASIPLNDLPSLAELRGNGEIRVLIAGDVAWVSWNPDSDGMREMLVRKIMPLPGAMLYTERDGAWYRLGEHLPRFDVPQGDGSDWPLLERTIFPEAIVATRPHGLLHDPIPIRLVRDALTPARQATALRCSPGALAVWAERATSAALAAVKGAWIRPGTPDGPAAEVLLVGSNGLLPPLAEGLRYWGTELLIPLGFRAEPDLPHSAIRTAAGATPEDLAVLDETGLELVPWAIFKPLSRASVRLMLIWERDAAWKESPG